MSLCCSTMVRCDGQRGVHDAPLRRRAARRTRSATDGGAFARQRRRDEARDEHAVGCRPLTARWRGLGPTASVAGCGAARGFSRSSWPRALRARRRRRCRRATKTSAVRLRRARQRDRLHHRQAGRADDAELAARLGWPPRCGRPARQRPSAGVRRPRSRAAWRRLRRIEDADTVVVGIHHPHPAGATGAGSSTTVDDARRSPSRSSRRRSPAEGAGAYRA